MSGPVSSLSLGVSCQDLINQDFSSKSDPICVMFTQNGDKWDELGRTEVLQNTLNPVWQTKFVIDYHFERKQMVKFEVYDADSKSSQLKRQDFAGGLEVSLGSVASALGKQFNGILVKGSKSKARGKIQILAEILSPVTDTVDIQIRAAKLANKDTFSKSDPFLEISKLMGEGHYSVVHRTEMMKNNLNPTWAMFKIAIRDLCNADYDKPIKLTVYDYDKSDKHEIIGSSMVTLNQLKQAKNENLQFPVVDPKKLSKKKYTNSGTLHVEYFKIEQGSTVSFVDYIHGGTTMNFSVAIDFTASNGDPRDPRSLHYLNPSNGKNAYTQAIQAIGDIIQDYDHDRQFPALGFGARVPPTSQVSHEFFLNLDQSHPFCAGTEGILQAYAKALQLVSLYGPTHFAPIINHVANFARAHQDGRQYFVLLIITDGIINDLDETKRALASASSLAMSIIVVGVGNEDFSNMKFLDSDLAVSYGGGAERDIVQFVEFRRFLNDNGMLRSAELAKEVLAEIPQQMLTWMDRRGIKPR
eukprot:snap_masked-scaffold699_size109694-processed-gene-0.13 protein:Tk03219 transcript:snap_masked-scaffold699_size109694-processed-gene-0.13-mRNA-1 annotation:"PREDICTED: copine-8"